MRGGGCDETAERAQPTELSVTAPVRRPCAAMFSKPSAVARPAAVPKREATACDEPRLRPT
eukprot:194000-Prymnesium_polylepis.1